MGTTPRITNLYVVCALATLGGLIQGFDVSSLSAILATPQYKQYFSNPDPVAQGGLTASMAAGSLVGALFAAWTGDRIGRRDSMFFACFTFIVGSALMCGVQNRLMLVIARVINGFGAGILTSQGPIYIAEVSRPHLRGRLISLQQWMISWGTLIMYFVSYGTSYIQSQASFRIPWGLQVVPALILIACLPLMPRSPRWLASQDRWEECLEVLALLHGKGDRHDPAVVMEMQEVRERVYLEIQYQRTSWLELFSARNIIRVHCCIFAHIWSQYCGTNALMYYIVYIFEMAGLNGQTALTSAAIQYIINVVMTVPALIFIDRLSRRGVMMWGSFTMAIWLFTTGAVMARYGQSVPNDNPDGSPAVTWVVNGINPTRAIIALSYLFIATYALTWGPMGWIYPSEIVPLYIRNKAVSLSTFFNWAANFSLTFFTPPAFERIQWKLFMIFGVFCIAALVHVFLFFHESVGKSLEEIDEVFDNDVFAFRRRRAKEPLDKQMADAAAKLDHKRYIWEDELVKSMGMVS